MKTSKFFSALCSIFLLFSLQASADLAGDLADLGPNPTQAQVDAAVFAAITNGETPTEIATALDGASIPVTVGAAAMGSAGLNPATVSNAYLAATGNQQIAAQAQGAAAQNQGQGQASGQGRGSGQGQGQGSGAPNGGAGGGGGGPSPS